MKRLLVNAYTLLADPAWLEHSVRSYYPIIERLFALYDQDGLSWSGHPIHTEECIERLRRIDTDGKVVFVPGSFTCPDLPAEAGETNQRNEGLALASRDCDWVLQLDTDEIALDPFRLEAAVRSADRSGFEALAYPARYVFTESTPGRFVENARRFGRLAASYPGAKAVRAHTSTTYCRDVDVPQYRVDFAWRNTDPYRSRNEPIHDVVGREQAILHMSWVRSTQSLEERRRYHTHAASIDWDRKLRQWRRARSKPYRFAAAHELRRGPEHYRIVRLPYTMRLEPQAGQTSQSSAP